MQNSAKTINAESVNHYSVLRIRSYRKTENPDPTKIRKFTHKSWFFPHWEIEILNHWRRNNYQKNILSANDFVCFFRFQDPNLNSLLIQIRNTAIISRDQQMVNINSV